MLCLMDFAYFIWPIIYITFFKLTTGDAIELGMQRPQMPLRRLILISVLALLMLRISIILAFRNEWYHLIPYSFYDFSDHFHNFNIYWEK